MMSLQVSVRLWKREIQAYQRGSISDRGDRVIYIKKVLDVWSFLEEEVNRIGKDINVSSLYEDIVLHISAWVGKEGKELKGNQLQRLDLSKLEDNRSDAFLHTLDRMMFHLKRRKEFFNNHQDEDYFEWLLEVPYLLGDKLEAYNVLLEESKFDFGIASVKSNTGYAIHNGNVAYENKKAEIALSM